MRLQVDKLMSLQVDKLMSLQVDELTYALHYLSR